MSLPAFTLLTAHQAIVRWRDREAASLAVREELDDLTDRLRLFEELRQFLPLVDDRAHCVMDELERWLRLDQFNDTKDKMRKSTRRRVVVKSALDRYKSALAATAAPHAAVVDEFVKSVVSETQGWCSDASGPFATFSENEASWIRMPEWREAFECYWGDGFWGPNLEVARRELDDYHQELRAEAALGLRLESEARRAQAFVNAALSPASPSPTAASSSARY